MDNFNYIFQSPIGGIGIIAPDEKLIGLEILLDTKDEVINPAPTPFITKIIKQLDNYFFNPKFRFSLPMKIVGTPMQKTIWKELQKIPIGDVVTYGEIARKIHTSPRVVGNACCKNPIPIIIPCHRVVGAVDLGGYSGTRVGNMLSVKQWLLEHEWSTR